MSSEWRQENLIKGAVGVRAVTCVEELKDALLALLKVSSALNLQLLEFKYLLVFLGARAVSKVTNVHYPVVSMVKTRVPEDFVCLLNGKKSLEKVMCNCFG